jgi:poly-gamma-glutamate synthesis protein (capsule biosynthesis protein)
VAVLFPALAGCGLLDSDDSDSKSADPALSAPPAPEPGGAPTGAPAPPVSKNPAGTVSIALAGDVHFHERTASRLNDPDPLGPIGKTLADADIAMVNLETAITERGTGEAKPYKFRAPANALHKLQDIGVDVLSLANNHAADFGPVGVQDTLAAIKNPPIPVVGFGPDAAAAYKPAIVEKNGVKVAFLSASQVIDITSQKYAAGPGKAGIATALKADRLVQAVKEAKGRADAVVVFMHWGIEGDKCPSADQKGLAKKLSDAGAAAVVGTHAHVMQGAGMMGDTYVGYGFGNFLWYGTSPYPNSNDTGVTTLTLTAGKVVKEQFTPASIDKRGVPVPATGPEAKRITDRRDGLRPCTGLKTPGSVG